MSKKIVVTIQQQWVAILLLHPSIRIHSLDWGAVRIPFHEAGSPYLKKKKTELTEAEWRIVVSVNQPPFGSENSLSLGRRQYII